MNSRQEFKLRIKHSFLMLREKPRGRCGLLSPSQNSRRQANFNALGLAFRRDTLRNFFEVAGEVASKAGLLKSAARSRPGGSFSVVPQTKEDNKPLSTARSFDEIRKEFPNAYRPWTPEDDSHLTNAYETCKEIETLANTFQRKPGAIQSRLVKLGLVG